MIKFMGLTKQYGDFTAVDNLNLEIRPGKIFGFLGPNGAGKTTTIKMMVGLLKPERGTVSVDGLDIVKETTEVKKITGYVPEQPFLYERLTGREFLEFVCGLWQMEEKKKQANIEKYLTLLNLQDVADDFMQSYSSGMKQKMNIIQALVHEPKILVLDEPLNALDPRSSKQVKDLLKEFAKSGKVVFIATHILDAAERLCAQVGIINKGKLVTTGTLEDLRVKANEEGGTLEEIFLKLTENLDGKNEIFTVVR